MNYYIDITVKYFAVIAKRKENDHLKKITVSFVCDENSDHIEVSIRAPEKNSDVDKLIEMISGYNGNKIMAYDSSGCRCSVDEKDILFVSSSGKQVHIVTENGFYFVKQRLWNVEELLDNSRFLRISRFEIINLSKVRKYDFTLNGSFRIEFINGMETWASRRYISAVKKRLSGEEGKNC